MPRALIVGDAVVSSGFARCTHAAADALYAAGWEVVVLGINYFGAPPNPCPYEVWPCFQPHENARNAFGSDALPIMFERVEPDVVVLLNDPWNIPMYIDALGDLASRAMLVGWLAVDAKNQIAGHLNRLDHVVVWTRFAKNELIDGGYEGPISVVPLGVDLDVFSPRDRDESRALLLPELPDAFVVGVVGRNQPRKRIDLALWYFSEWIESNPGIDDAYLYIHSAPTGEVAVGVRELVRYHGLSGRVIVNEPHMGRGIPNGDLPAMYSALDVYLSTTQGEGWGLPALEAMACGVPCILPDWSAFGDWARGAALLVPCTSIAPSAPMNAGAYTIGGVVDRVETVKALNDLYCDPASRELLRERGLARASMLPWDATGRYIVQILSQLASQPDATTEAVVDA